jgi:hypothetical protein
MEPRNCIYTASFGSSLPYLRNYICQRVPIIRGVHTDWSKHVIGKLRLSGGSRRPWLTVRRTVIMDQIRETSRAKGRCRR